MAESTRNARPLPIARHKRAGRAGRQAREWVRARKEFLFVPLALVLLVGAWQGIVWLGGYPAFILPSPGRQ